MNLENVVLLSLPRGGVVVANEIAQELNLPLDVVISRKIGAPGHEEYGIGALSEDGVPQFNREVSRYYDFESPRIQDVVQKETHELKRRINLYRNGKALPNFDGKTVIVIDDGLATGVTAVAAAKYLRTLHPRELILAVPVGPDELSEAIAESYDEVICLYALADLQGVGLWYDDFGQVEDAEVVDILKTYH